MLDVTPSSARTVRPPQYSIAGVSTALFTTGPLSWPTKAAADDLDYSLDLTAWAADAQDSIAGLDAISVEPSSDPQDIGVVWAVAAGQQAVLMLSGGVAGRTYQITVPARTVRGRRCSWTIRLAISDDTPSCAPAAPTTPPSVSAETGDAITLNPESWPDADSGVSGATYSTGGVVAASAGDVHPADFSFARLPATDPQISGRLWSSGGIVMISDGPLPAQTDRDRYFAGLPAVDPLVAGAAWSNGGALTISAGDTA